MEERRGQERVREERAGQERKRRDKRRAKKLILENTKKVVLNGYSELLRTRHLGTHVQGICNTQVEVD